VSEEEIDNFLLTFRNTKDKDIERFLREKALIFKKRNWCNTFLLVGEENNKYGFKVEGYFTLSFKVLSFENDVSKTVRKKLNNGVDADAIPVILIGQLGKYIDDDNMIYGDTCADDLIYYAVQIIKEINELVPCRYILLECEKNRTRLRDLYTSLGFSQIGGDSDYIQLVKKI